MIWNGDNACSGPIVTQRSQLCPFVCVAVVSLHRFQVLGAIVAAHRNEPFAE